MAREKRRLIIGILSGSEYEDRRDACRKTWVGAASRHPDIEAVFLFSGNDDGYSRRGDCLTLPCRDGYDHLPEKVGRFLRWCLDTYDFEYVMKADDDTYVAIDRMLRYPLIGQDYIGCNFLGFAHGGAGYVLSRRAVHLIADQLCREGPGPEDQAVARLLRSAGVKQTVDTRFCVGGAAPQGDNQLLTGHYLKPQEMLAAHERRRGDGSDADMRDGWLRVDAWTVAWGELGLGGQLGYAVEKRREVVPPPGRKAADGYRFISAHADSFVRVDFEVPVVGFGFMDEAARDNLADGVDFAADGRFLGALHRAHQRTAEIRLEPGRHILSAVCRYGHDWRHSVWAFRPVRADAVRMVAPGADRAALDRRWPGHPECLSISGAAADVDGTAERSYSSGLRSLANQWEGDERVLLWDGRADSVPESPDAMLARAMSRMAEDPDALFIRLSNPLPAGTNGSAPADPLKPVTELSVGLSLWRTAPLEEILVSAGEADIVDLGRIATDYYHRTLRPTAHAFECVAWAGNGATETGAVADEAKAATEAVGPQSANGNRSPGPRDFVSGMEVAFLTFDRSPNPGFIDRSVASLLGSDPGMDQHRIHVIVDGADASFLAPELARPNVVVSTIPHDEREHSKQQWQVHRRIAYSYHRGFRAALADGASGLLVCEDDVAFRPRFLSRLNQVLAEMFDDGWRSFVLSLYDPHHAPREAAKSLRRGQLYGAYPGWDFFGGQAVYFPRAVLEQADEFWTARGWKDRELAEKPNDLLIGDFGEMLWTRDNRRGGIYCVYRSLVQHTGNASMTGLSPGYHWSNSFDRPWHDEAP